MRPRARHLTLVPPVETSRAEPSSNGDELRPRARATAELPPGGRRLRSETLAWALATSRPADPDALSAVIAAKLEMDGHPLCFTESDVFGLLWHRVVNWCTVRGTAVPDGVAETLWTLLDRLSFTGQFAPGSDDLARLRRPLLTGGGLGADGRARIAAGARRRHPSGRRSDAG